MYGNNDDMDAEVVEDDEKDLRSLEDEGDKKKLPPLKDGGVSKGWTKAIATTAWSGHEPVIYQVENSPQLNQLLYTKEKLKTLVEEDLPW